ncbi:MAG: OmpA family protein [Bacteroidota bacterium]
MEDERPSEDDDMPTAPFWMATFSDMATLLLCFFVLLVAMSEIRVDRFMEALSYFKGRTGIMDFENVVPSNAVRTVVNSSADAQEAEEIIQEFAEKFEEVSAFIEANELEDKVQVSLTDRGLHVVITDSVMFRSASAVLTEPSRDLLGLLAQVIDDRVKAVVVEGHTDNLPIRSALYPSNWELSAARAAAVVRFMLDQEGALPPASYFATGSAEFHPVDTNATPAGRNRNRRVEILFSWTPWQNSISPTPRSEAITEQP